MCEVLLHQCDIGEDRRRGLMCCRCGCALAPYGCARLPSTRRPSQARTRPHLSRTCRPSPQASPRLAESLSVVSLSERLRAWQME